MFFYDQILFVKKINRLEIVLITSFTILLMYSFELRNRAVILSLTIT